MSSRRVIYLHYLRLVVLVTGSRTSRFRSILSLARSLARSPVRVQCTKKGKPAGRKFITREQQVITLKADFSEAVIRGRKESAREKLPRGSRVNDSNLRLANGANESEFARTGRA